MSVYCDNVPVERFELLVKRSGVDNVNDRSVYLKSVEVNEDAEVIELVMSGKHSRLPDLTLFRLAVAENGIHTVILIGNLAGKSHAASGGNSEAERACRHIDAGRMLHIGVTLKETLCIAEAFQLRNIKISSVRKSRIESGSRVSL